MVSVRLRGAIITSLGPTPRLLIGRPHATSARRGAPRRVPLFKPTQRLETPDKESRTRQSYSHRATASQCVPPRKKTHHNLIFAYTFGLFGVFLFVFVLENMDVQNVEDWSRGEEAAVLHSRRLMERGGEQQLEESRYEPGLTLVDSGSDPRVWLAPAQPPGTCAAHASSPDYLRHSPCPSTGSYHGRTYFHFRSPATHTSGALGICSCVNLLGFELKGTHRQNEPYILYFTECNVYLV